MKNTNGRKIRHRRRKRRYRRRKKFIISGFLVMVILSMGYFACTCLMKENFGQKYTKNELTAKGYPESLAELYVRNNEAREFVLEYLTYEGNVEDIDTESEIRKGEFPMFLQWDQRWGYEKYGDDFMAVTGCGPTALSIVYSGLTGESELHPMKLARLAEAGGYYVNGSGTSWNMMTDLAEEIGLTVHKPAYTKESILAELEQGCPIICIMGPGDFTTTGHFIVLTGVCDGKIMVHDPNSIKNSEKLWDIDILMRQIRDLWAYS